MAYFITEVERWLDDRRWYNEYGAGECRAVVERERRNAGLPERLGRPDTRSANASSCDPWAAVYMIAAAPPERNH